MWEFTFVRRRALMYLHEEDAITRLIVARQYDMPEWLFPALKELASRATPLTVDELESLGLDVAVKVIALREAVRGSPKPTKSVSELPVKHEGLNTDAVILDRQGILPLKK